MAASYPDSTSPRSLRGATLALALMLAHPTHAAVPKPNLQAPIVLDADSSDLDYRNNNIVFRNVKITQANMSVEAEQAQANGVNFDNSHWTFRGRVRMRLDQGLLTADDAEITFMNNALAKAVITGAPARFEQPREKTGEMARGRANSITYDARDGSVRLTKNAWLTDGKNEIRGESLKYNVNQQRVEAPAAEQGSQRIRITIAPPDQQKK